MITYSSTPKTSALRPSINIIALAITLVVNTLANILPMNGLTTGEISDFYPSLFTPAGYVFSIWGLIYSLLISFVIFQALGSQRLNPRLERLNYTFALSCLFNSLWIFAWHYRQMLLAQLCIMAVLILLIIAYRLLEVE
ncbi:MAG: TspO/MBR family protein, partial [Deinococcales bacterium]